jgi:ankyrin repeat protein
MTPNLPKIVPPIFGALRMHRPDEVRRLVQAVPAMLESHDRHGFTPLLFVVSRGWHAPVQLLLELGADPNGPSLIKASPPLLFALDDRDDEPMVDLLLRHGADPDRPDAKGVTPIMSGVTDGRMCCVQRLLAAGAATPIDLVQRAFSSGSEAMVDLVLSRGLPVDAPDRSGLTALYYAAQQGDEAMTHKALACGADPHLELSTGETVLKRLEQSIAHMPDWCDDALAIERARVCVATIKRVLD